MAEGRLCPNCGSLSLPDAARCENCGERFAGLGLLTEQENWQSSAPGRSGAPPRSGVPLPPQLREEQTRLELLAQQTSRQEEQARLQAEQTAQDRLEAARRAAQINEARARLGTVGQEVVANCAACGAEMGQGGISFSFCLRCGADAVQTDAVQTGTVWTEPVPTLEPRSRKQQELQELQELRERLAIQAAERVEMWRASGQVTVRPQEQQETRYTVQQSYVMPQNRQTLEERHTRQNMTSGTASPTVAAFMSFVLPGIGQLMNGQGAKGVLLLLATFVTVVVLSQPGLALPVLIGRILAAIDAYRIAERRRSGQFVRDGEWDFG